ncbi:hypothetical protein FBU30_008747 [Linnemannia zychae]|nr:hypothetical protein FBU30_008747 [Linnemannia zychae]
MIGIKSALGLMCLLLASTTSTSAMPIVGPETTTVAAVNIDNNSDQLVKRSFNPRQKWQSDELNCVQILNPAPGATYYPGYFVRLNYGAEQCDATATGPWTIHLYNNLDIQGDKVSYDYHEVIASGINEYKTQYTWTIPSNQNDKAKNVKKANQYYVRIETNSHEGLKLVGNAGPFAIYPESWYGSGLRPLSDDNAQPLVELKRREDLIEQPTGADAEVLVRIAPNKPTPANDVISTLSVPEVELPSADTNAPVVESAPAFPNTLAAEPLSTVPDAPAVEPAPIAPNAAADTKDKVVDLAAPNIDATEVKDVDLTHPDTTTIDPNIDANLGIPDKAPISEDYNLLPEDEINPSITQISSASFVPNKLLVAGAIAGGAIGLGILGASFLGQVGGILGAVVGGVIGGIGVLLHTAGVPV